MMKRLTYICVLLLSVCLMRAEVLNVEGVDASADCRLTQLIMGYPSYYCDCHEANTEFSYPMDTMVRDTMWFSARVDQLKQGLSAYWFSEVPVTIEVYAFCSSKAPTFVLTADANQMKEMDMADINRKLDQMGETAQLMAQTLTPRIRVYPSRGGSGHVYCYPYDKGPHSTCDTILPLLPRMTYVCDATDEVYLLAPASMPADGRGFIRWKQKYQYPATLTLRADSCTGEVVQQQQMVDTAHVMLLDSVRVAALRAAGRPLYLEVNHAAGFAGRVQYYPSVNWTGLEMDTTVCQGQGLVLPDTVLYEATTYTNDIRYYAGDTLSRNTYHLQLDTPSVVYDTLRLKASALPRVYRNQETIRKGGWGDYEFLIHTPGRCDEHCFLHVEHLLRRDTVEQDTTLCEGRVYRTPNGKVYREESVVTTTSTYEAADADVERLTILSVYFEAPELEYDTITLAPSQLEGYRYQDLTAVVPVYGEQEIYVRANNTCTRHVFLMIIEGEEPIHTGLRNSSSVPAVTKFVRDGRVWIYRAGVTSDVLGRRIF